MMSIKAYEGSIRFSISPKWQLPIVTVTISIIRDYLIVIYIANCLHNIINTDVELHTFRLYK